MKMTPKFAVLGTFIGCFICALVVLSVWLAGSGNQGAQAQGHNGLDPNIVGIDAITTSNTATFLGTIDRCVEVAGVGATFPIDVFLDDVPLSSGSYHNLGGFEYRLNYDPAKLKVNTTAHTYLMDSVGSIADMGDCSAMGSPCPDTDGQLYTSVVGLGGETDAELPGSLGVLSRLQMEVIGGNGTLAYLTLPVADLALGGYEPGVTPWTDQIDQVWDGNYALPYGIIAIGTTCPAAPPVADVGVIQALVDKEPDDPVTGVCGGTPPGSINVSSHEWICLQNTLTNVSGDTPVDVDLTKTGSAPVSPGGGEVSYHCDGTEDEISVDGTPVTMPCVASTVLEGGEIIVKHLNIPLAQGSPEQMEEEWDVHCTEPSTHAFTFTSEIDLSNPSGVDPVPGNNTDTDVYSVDCLAVADLRVTSATVNAPDNFGQGGAFNVTVNATVTNAGTYGPVNADVTFNLDLTGATGCSKSPVGSQTVQGLSLGGPLSPSATWSVTCSTTGSKTFNGGATVVLDDDEHISNPDSNDTASDPDGDSTNITASADARILNWIFPDDLDPPAAVGPAESGDECKNAVDDDGDTVVNDGCPDIALNQVLVDPGVAEDVVAPEMLDNDPAHTTYTDTSITVSIALTQTPDANCSATPDGGNPTQAILPLNGNDVTVTPNETWEVTLNTGDSCTIDFGKTIAITTGGVGEYNAADNTAARSVDLVADTDGDTVPDNYSGLNDNCDGIANPDQADVDGDDIGDVCDADNDNDGICDAGKSAAYCTGSDNCRLIANAGQEDADTDSIGNVCELDVTCDDLLDGGDVVQLMRYIVGLLTVSDQCPPPAGSINGPRATAYADGIDGGDVVAMLQCIAGFHNIVCPAPTAP